MRCDFCYHRNKIKKPCNEVKMICGKFEMPPTFIFRCRKWNLWAGLEFCNYKVLNHPWCCSKECAQYVEMMKVAHKYIVPFPYINRLHDPNLNYRFSPGRKWKYALKRSGLIRRERNKLIRRRR
jgi:hypothetical protein